MGTEEIRSAGPRGSTRAAARMGMSAMMRPGMRRRPPHHLPDSGKVRPRRARAPKPSMPTRPARWPAAEGPGGTRRSPANERPEQGGAVAHQTMRFGLEGPRRARASARPSTPTTGGGSPGREKEGSLQGISIGPSPFFRRPDAPRSRDAARAVQPAAPRRPPARARCPVRRADRRSPSPPRPRAGRAARARRPARARDRDWPAAPRSRRAIVLVHG
jgi:hypothetical protein